ncbi:MAG: DUF362 domain-containing protein [Syntrophorhabdaceae bacterium]
MEKVIAGGIDSYDIDKIREFIEQGLAGINLSIKDRSILIKPNLLSAKSPDRAVTTHPDFIAAIAGLLRDHGCSVFLGDSPGYESLNRVLKAGHYTDMIKRYDIRVVSFNKEIHKPSRGISPYHDFTFGEDPDFYDLVVNVPKLKTHGMMGMTLGIKNTYGFIRGFLKGHWHVKAGRDRNTFASILVDIHRIAAPALTILDGILGMCGDGPSSGTPIPCRIIAMSRNAFALDDFIERRLCPHVSHPITELAVKHGFLETYDLVDRGLPPRPPSFPMPRSCDTDWNLPSGIKRLLRSVLVKKPRATRKLCKQCGICARVCPAGALELDDNNLRFDYAKCIRCYCCQEMCPHGAIRT